jgi:hypothetical protein
MALGYKEEEEEEDEEEEAENKSSVDNSIRPKNVYPDLHKG